MKKLVYLFTILTICFSTIKASANPLDSISLKQIISPITKQKSNHNSIQNSQLTRYIDQYFEDNNSNSFNFPASINDNLQDEIRNSEVAYTGNPLVKKADSLFNKIDIVGMVDKLTGGQIIKLPVGFTKSQGETKIEIIIPRAKYYENYCALEIYCRIVLKDKRKLFFGAENIKYNYTTGFTGDVKLALFADFPFKMGGSNNIGVTLKGAPRGSNSGTYVIMDCDGFKEARLEVDVQVTRDWILPCDKNGTVIENERVKSNFGITVTDINEMVLNMSLPSFTPAKAKEKVVFEVENAVIDFSDEANAPGFVLPNGFFNESDKVLPDPKNPKIMERASSNALAEDVVDDGGDGENGDGDSGIEVDNDPNLWRGIFIKEFKMIFPKAFKNRAENDRLAAGVENLYIDSRGLSGGFFVDNLLSMDQGEMGNWSYSIDKIGVDINYSQLTGFKFVGGLKIPISGDNEYFTYGASGNIPKDMYNFFVRIDSSMTFPMLKAGKVVLSAGSGVYVNVVDDDFTVSAQLNGNLDISIKKGDDKTEEGKNKTLQIAAVTFHNLIISQEKPFLGLGPGGIFKFDSIPIMDGLPIDIRNASLVHSASNEKEYALTFVMDVSLMDSNDGGASCTGGTSIIFERSADAKKYTFNSIKYKLMFVEIHFGDAGYIKGGISSFDNAEYGKGYKGSLEGGFSKKDNGTYLLSLSANAIFGKTSDNLKYWYFDAFLSSSAWSVPIIPGILNANGFGGGAYYHMKMAALLPSDLLASPDPNKPPSGIKYVPDATTSIGFKASLGLTGTDDSFLGFATLEMSFSKGGGIKNILFYGRGDFMMGKGKKENSPDTKNLANTADETKSINVDWSKTDGADRIKAAVILSLTFGEKFTFSGAFEAHMNLKNGLVTGTAMVDMYYSSPKWHFYLGGYSDKSVKNSAGITMMPISASLNVGKSAPIKASMYFLMGNDLPGPPPLHPDVAKFFGIPVTTNRNNMGSDLAGFALGAGVFLDVEYKKSNNKYVNLKGGAGFDFAMLRYSNTSYCAGFNGEHGINYWRASGRLYAYLGVSGKWVIPLPSVNAGILIQGDIPDPSYIDVHAKLKILGININFNAELGKKCNVVN